MLWTSYSDLQPIWRALVRFMYIIFPFNLHHMLYMLRLLPEIHCLEVSSTFGNGRDWCIWTHIYVSVVERSEQRHLIVKRLSSHFHDARRPLSGAFKVVFSTGCLNEYITKVGFLLLNDASNTQQTWDSHSLRYRLPTLLLLCHVDLRQVRFDLSPVRRRLESMNCDCCGGFLLMYTSSVPKHTLPSVPRPTFYWPCNLGKGPTPRSSNRSPLYDEGQDRLKLVSKRSVRGPWDHSGSIPLKFDVDRLIRAPQPVAMSVQ